MDNANAIVQLTALKGQHENDATAIGVALSILTAGYESDTASIKEEVEAGIENAVATAVAPLNERIAELEQQLNPPSDEEPT